MGRISGIAGGLGGHVWPGELPVDAAAACEALAAESAAVRVAASRRIVLVAHWLDLHAPLEHPDRHDEGAGQVLPGTERYVPSGADGTPQVAEFACAELGTLLGRFAHRLKTHGRWRLLHLRPGHVLWHSPHGMSYLVDPLGTHPVPHAVLPWLLRGARLGDDLETKNHQAA